MIRSIEVAWWKAASGSWSKRSRQKTGFTLIEILVVVAIIALLVAILVPSLMKAKEQSTGALCSSNMHQIMMGMHGYVAANKVLPASFDILWRSWAEAGSPGGGLPTGTHNWRPSDSWLGLPWGPKQFNHQTNASDQQALWDFVGANAPKLGSLYRYVRGEKTYLCPKDVPGFPEPENIKGGGGNGRFSYTMLGSLGYKSPEKCSTFRYVANFQQIAGGYRPAISIPSGTRVSWGQSKMIVLAEEHPWNNTNHGWVGDSWAFDSYLAFRHHTDSTGGRGMFSFLDGHVEPRRYPYFIPIPGSVPPQYTKFQGVDILNEMKLPYSWQGNAGGAINESTFVAHFKYPYP